MRDAVVSKSLLKSEYALDASCYLGVLVPAVVVMSL